MPSKSPRSIARHTISIQQAALSKLSEQLDEGFDQACELMLGCRGKIIVIGMGKSGHIGKKIAATLSSTGSPALYIHPGEACHGDIGMIDSNDVVLAISYSGETEELLNTLPSIKTIGAPVIAITSTRSSTLGTHAVCTLCVAVDQEACPLNLAPTASTTSTLVLGDALAVALLNMRDFSPADFARRHPGGSLGKRLLLKVSDLMHSGEQLPTVYEDSTLEEALLEITSKRLGVTAVIGSSGNFVGIYTDGDLRRTINNRCDIYNTNIKETMTRKPLTITSDTLATRALYIMTQQKITSLAITQDDQLIGLLHIHDLLQQSVPLLPEQELCQ